MKPFKHKAFPGSVLLIAGILLLAGCKSAAPPTLQPQEPIQTLQSTTPPVEPSGNSSYPEPVQSNDQPAYPEPAQVQSGGPVSPYPEPVENAAQPDCPSGSGGDGAVRLDDFGICFLSPAGFTSSTEGILNGIAVFGPALDNNAEPLQAIFNLQVKPAEGRSLDEAVSEIFEQNPDASIEKTAIRVNGYEAYRLEGVPGRTLSRMLVFVVNSRVYLMTFSPLDEALAQAKPDVEKLWDTITQTIQFFRP